MSLLTERTAATRHTTSEGPTTSDASDLPAPIKAIVTAPVPPEATLGRSIGIWVVLCTVVMLVGVGGGVWATTGEVVNGLAVGGFAALWGGPGFGVMFGSAAHSLPEERAEAAAARASAPH